MSKVKSSLSLLPSKQNVTKAPTNLKHSNAFESHCLGDANSQNQVAGLAANLLSKQKEHAISQQQIQQQIKKKRTALENISNATNCLNLNGTGLNASTNTTLSNNTINTSTSTNGTSSSSNVNKEIAKKSRFGIGQQQTANTLGGTISNYAGPPHQAAIKKSDSILTNKKYLSSSKENLTNILPINQPNKKTFLIGGQSNKQIGLKNVENNNNTNLCGIKQHSMSATAASSHAKTDKTIVNELKQETIIKIEQIQTEFHPSSSSSSTATTTTTTSEVHLERQLATTCISSSASTSSVSSTSSITSSTSNNSGSTKEITIVEEKDQSIKWESDSGDKNNEQEIWEDIDANDNDEFNVCDYVKKIFSYYREREDKFIVNDYIKDQPHISRQMRLLLVDWMVEVQQQLEFNHEVLYLSVKLLDLFLNSRRIEKEKLQLLGGAAMFIACKFEERMPPIIDDFIYVSDNAYDRKELIKMEIDILKTVRFDIGVPLSYTFLRRYSKCVRADMKFLTLARYILELSLQDYSFAYVKDSLKACAALYLALKMAVRYENSMMTNESGNNNNEQTNNLTVSTANLTSTEWNATLVHYTGSNLEDFVHLLPQMNNLIHSAPSSKYKTIFKKYSHQVFYEVAKIAPLNVSEIDSILNKCLNGSNKSTRS